MKKIKLTKVLGVIGLVVCSIMMLPFVMIPIFFIFLIFSEKPKTIAVEDLELMPQTTAMMMGLPDDVSVVYDTAQSSSNELDIIEVRAHLEGKGVEPFLKNLDAKVKADPVHWRKGESGWKCAPVYYLYKEEAYNPYTFAFAWGFAGIPAPKECATLAKSGMVIIDFSSATTSIVIHYELGDGTISMPPKYFVADSLAKKENLILPCYHEVNYGFARFAPWREYSCDCVETVEFDSPRDAQRFCSTLPSDAYDAETDEWVIRHRAELDSVRWESHYLHVRIKKDGHYARIEYGESYD